MSAYERLEDLKAQRAMARDTIQHLSAYANPEMVGKIILHEMALTRLVEAAEAEHVKESQQIENTRESARAEKLAALQSDMVSEGHRKTLADRLAFLNGMGSNPTTEERAKIQRGEVSNHEVLEARHREIEAIKSELDLPPAA